MIENMLHGNSGGRSGHVVAKTPVDPATCIVRVFPEQKAGSKLDVDLIFKIRKVNEFLSYTITLPGRLRLCPDWI